MDTTTIACPVGMDHPGVDPATAPIWLDAAGNEYRIASGVIPDAEPTEWTTAAPDRVTVIVGMDGFSALSMMGLMAKPVEGV